MMEYRSQQRPLRQSGVALAIVVWFIAGMSLLVAGIVAQARVDTRLAQVHADRARATAVGDGAVRLFLAELASSGSRAHVSASRTYFVGDNEVLVMVASVSGLINLNSASIALLRALFASEGDLSTVEAQRLAQSVVAWRNSSPTLTGPRNRFETPEDLMRIPGMTRALYDAVRDYVVAGRFASNAMVPTQAGAVVRGLLREAGQASSPGMEKKSIDNIPSGGNLRVDAIMTRGRAKWLRRQWLVPGNDNNSLLPWNIVRVEPARVVAQDRD